MDHGPFEPFGCIFISVFVFALKWTMVRLNLFWRICLVFALKWTMVRLSLVLWFFRVSLGFCAQVDRGPFEDVFKGVLDFKGFFWCCTQMECGPFELFALIFEGCSWYLRSNGPCSVWAFFLHGFIQNLHSNGPWSVWAFLFWFENKCLLVFALKWTMVRLRVFLKDVLVFALKWTMVRLSFLLWFLLKFFLVSALKWIMVRLSDFFCKVFVGLCTLMDRGALKLFALIFEGCSWYLRSNGPWSAWAFFLVVWIFCISAFRIVVFVFKGVHLFLHLNGP